MSEKSSQHRRLSEVAHLVFGELLDDIFRHLSTTNLIEFRRVSGHWCHNTSRLLLKRVDNQIIFKFFPMDSDFIFMRNNVKTLTSIDPNDPAVTSLQSWGKNESKNLTQLTSLLSFSSLSSSLPKLPCVNFSFCTSGDLDRYDAQAFFDLHGPSIKGLILDLTSESNWHNETGVNTMVRLLSSQLPNLERLKLSSLPSKWMIHNASNQIYDGFPPDSKLSSLSILTIGDEFSRSGICLAFLGDILKTAVNLKKVQVTRLAIPATDIAILWPSFPPNNFSIEVNLAAIFLFTEPIDRLEKFAEVISAQNNIRLQKMYVHLSQPSGQNLLTPQERGRVVEAFGKILKNSASTLLQLTMGHSAFIFLNQLTLMTGPILLPKLTKFRLRRPQPQTANVEQPMVVPTWVFRVCEIFPRLTSMEIDISQNVKSITKYFPRDQERVPTVTELTLNLFHPTCSFPHSLHKTFPRVQVLRLSHIKNFPKVASHVWKFGEVFSLNISLHIGLHDGNPNRWPGLEAAFTGFSEEAVRNLREQQQQQQNEEMDKEQIAGEALGPPTPPSFRRENWSILNMTKLRHLKIVFHDNTAYLTPSYNLFSTLLATHALNQMPGLSRIKFCTEKESIRHDGNLSVLAEALLPLRSMIVGREVTWSFIN